MMSGNHAATAHIRVRNLECFFITLGVFNSGNFQHLEQRGLDKHTHTHSREKEKGRTDRRGFGSEANLEKAPHWLPQRPSPTNEKAFVAILSSYLLLKEIGKIGAGLACGRVSPCGSTYLRLERGIHIKHLGLGVPVAKKQTWMGGNRGRH